MVFGSTAKWAANGYAKFKQTRGAIGPDDLNDLCHFLADVVPLISTEKKNMLHLSAEICNSLTEFIFCRLYIEGTDVDELDPKSRYLAIQVVVEELLKRGVPDYLVELRDISDVGSKMSAITGTPKIIQKDSLKPQKPRKPISADSDAPENFAVEHLVPDNQETALNTRGFNSIRDPLPTVNIVHRIVGFFVLTLISLLAYVVF